MIINLIIPISSFVFLSLSAVLFRGLNLILKGLRRESKSYADKNISVIIAAKNEENNLEELFYSLASQNYPKDKFEIIFVDDNSADHTFLKAEQLLKGINQKKIIKAERKKFPGKKGALHAGIQEASYDYILITDADCVAEKNWINSFSQKFNEGYDIVFGIAPLKAINKFKFPLYENLITNILTFSAAGLGQSYSAASRSFGFSSETFKKINGFENIQETLSGDDDLIIREAVKNNLKIGAVVQQNSFVYSHAKENLKEYFQQKSRHVKTSLYYLTRHRIFLFIWHSINIGFIVSPLLAFVSPKFLILFFIKLIVDIFLIKKYQKFFSYNFGMFEIFYYQFLYEFFLMINFMNALVRKDRWK